MWKPIITASTTGVQNFLKMSSLQQLSTYFNQNLQAYEAKRKTKKI